MPDARLIVHSPVGADLEVKLSGQASIGRAFDNLVHLEAKRVSRYHAIIQERAGEFWLRDLGSVNGTTVNDDPVTSVRKLKDGDRVSFGGEITAVFRAGRAAQQSPTALAATDSPASVETLSAPPATAQANGQSPRVIIGVVAGLAVVGIALLLLVSITGGETAPGAVHIVSPANGTVVDEPTVLRVEVGNPKSIRRVIYEFDGYEVARSETPPDYEALLDPDAIKQKVSDLEGPHTLSVTIEDKGGKRKSPPGTVLLAFNLKQPGSGDPPAPATPIPNETASGEDIDVRLRAEEIAYKISKQKGYWFTPGFISEINKRRQEYVGVSIGKSRYDEIERAFTTDQGLPSKLGAIMAMSLINKLEENARTPSALRLTNAEVNHFWVPKDIALQRECIQEGDESKFKTLAQSAECASSYMKALWGQFDEGDFMYAIACYGLTIDDVGKLSNQLRDFGPDARKDFLAMTRSGLVSRDGADRVFRFFAAAIFGKYPEGFD